MDEYRKWGNNINTKKTEYLTTELENKEKLEIENGGIKVITLKYLYSVLESDGQSYCRN